MRKINFAKSVSFVLAAVLATGFTLALAGCNKEEKDTGDVSEFSYWMAVSESSEYYLDYNENPVMKYVTQNKTFKNQEGNDAKVSFAIQHPPVGKEVDNLNTLISTGSYTDIVDTTYGTGDDLADMYKEGLVLDLTEYVENNMPNYKAFVDAHPEIDFTKNVDGEEKYLDIKTVSDIFDANSLFAGFSYRRDWIVKYGVNPETLYDPMSGEPAKDNPNAGKPFSGYFSLDNEGNEVKHDTLQENTDGESWVDDVVFPSGNYHPIYISDWEWMFDIFQKAIDEQAIEDGYVLSVYYPGYIANGDLVTSFGGGGSHFYLHEDGTMHFGAAEEHFKVYMQALNTWWNNGWIDQRFSERSNDVFYRIDETSFRSGKVGFWVGASNNLDARLYNPEAPLTDGIVVFGAAQPINDIYGSEEHQLKIPYTMYSPISLAGGGLMITDKAKDKDLTLLTGFIDYMYSDEGALLKTVGLNAEQAEVAKDPFYEKYGLNDGAYTTEERDGQTYYKFVPELMQDVGLQSAATGNRMVGRRANEFLDLQFGIAHLESRENWLKYPGTGFAGYVNTRDKLDPEAAQDFNKIGTRLDAEYMAIAVPQFIKGEKNFDEDWETFKTDLAKRNYQKPLDKMNAILAAE